MTVFGDKYKLGSSLCNFFLYPCSSLYNFLYIPISSPLLVPNIPLSTLFSVQIMSLHNEYLMPLITFITDYTEISETSLTVGIHHSLHRVPLRYSVRPTAVVTEETLSVYWLVLLSNFFLAFYILPPSREGLCNSGFTNKIFYSNENYSMSIHNHYVCHNKLHL